MTDLHPSIRRAAPYDAHAIATINVDAWRAGYRCIVPDETLDGLSVDERAAGWAERLAEPGHLTFVAELDGEVGGYCSVTRPSRDEEAGLTTAEIAALYVAPARWRAGIGRALLAEALAALEDGPWTEVTLWVFAANERGRAFYAAHAFELAGEVVNEFFDVPVVRLRRALGALGGQKLDPLAN